MISTFQVLDSSPFLWNLDSGFQSLDSGFQSPGFSISRAKLFPDSGSHKQKFTGLRNPDSLKSGDILKAGAIVTLSVKAGAIVTLSLKARAIVTPSLKAGAIVTLYLKFFLNCF